MRTKETQKKAENGQIVPYLVRELIFDSDSVKVITQGQKSKQELIRRLELYNKMPDANKVNIVNLDGKDSISIALDGDTHQIVDILADEVHAISSVLQRDTHQMLDKGEKSNDCCTVS